MVEDKGPKVEVKGQKNIQEKFETGVPLKSRAEEEARKGLWLG